MKYLEAVRKAAQQPMENKMMPGTRTDQDGSTPRVQLEPPGPHSDEIVALAESLGVDLSTVTGTGKDGRVLMRDVRAAAAAKAT